MAFTRDPYECEKEGAISDFTFQTCERDRTHECDSWQ